MSDDKKLERAKKRVEQLKSFYMNLIAYCVVIPFLFVLDVLDHGNWWFYWPALGWGLFLVLHGISLGTVSKEWEERKIKEYMAQDK